MGLFSLFFRWNGKKKNKVFYLLHVERTWKIVRIVEIVREVFKWLKMVWLMFITARWGNKYQQTNNFNRFVSARIKFNYTLWHSKIRRTANTVYNNETDKFPIPKLQFLRYIAYFENLIPILTNDSDLWFAWKLTVIVGEPLPPPPLTEMKNKTHRKVLMFAGSGWFIYAQRKYFVFIERKRKGNENVYWLLKSKDPSRCVDK